MRHKLAESRAQLAERHKVLKLDIKELEEELEELGLQVADDAQVLEGIWDYLDEEVKPSVMTVSNNGPEGDMSLTILEDAIRVYENFGRALKQLRRHWGDLERVIDELAAAETTLDEIRDEIRDVSYENLEQESL